MQNYHSDKAAATVEERRFNAWLRTQGYSVFEASVAQDKRGVDSYAINGNRVIEFDVKSDGQAAKTGNVGVELWTSYDSGREDRPGWGTAVHCDWWVWLFRGTDTYVALKPEEVVPRLEEFKENFPIIPSYKDQGKTTFNLLLPWGRLDELGLSYQQGQLK